MQSHLFLIPYVHRHNNTGPYRGCIYFSRVFFFIFFFKPNPILLGRRWRARYFIYSHYIPARQLIAVVAAAADNAAAAFRLIGDPQFYYRQLLQRLLYYYFGSRLIIINNINRTRRFRLTNAPHVESPWPISKHAKLRLIWILVFETLVTEFRCLTRSL